MSTEEKQNKPARRLTYLVLSAALLGIFFSYLFSINMSMNLNDPDVWWHIAMGEYVLENHDIPREDPFAFTSPSPLSKNQIMGLRSHWLGQVCFALAHKAAGLFGVVLLRNFLIIMPMLILLLWLMRRKADVLESFVLLALPALMLCAQVFYAFERPQGISFNLVLINILILERLRRKAPESKFDHSYWALPLSMAVWSNVHAGYIVGSIILLIYLFSDIISTFVSSAWHTFREEGESIRVTLLESLKATWRHMRYDNKRFYIVILLALLTQGLNPNGFHTFSAYVGGLTSMFFKDLGRYTGVVKADPDWVRSVVLEYKPLYYFYNVLEYKWIMFYWIFSGFIFAVLAVKYWLKRSIDLAEFLTVFFIALFANMYARGIMFSLTVMPVFLAKSLLEIRAGGAALRMPRKLIIVASIIILVSFVSYVYPKSPTLYRNGIPVALRYKLCTMGDKDEKVCKEILARDKAERQREDRFVTLWYPNYLARFLKEVRPDPPMYNYYTWGGYLIYSLFPEYQVFIDGRALDNRISTMADRVLKSHPSWKQTLNGAYGVNFIAIPAVFRESGHIIPLATTLAYEDDWSLVFAKNNSLLFLRNRPVGSKSTPRDWAGEKVSDAIEKNRKIIRKHNIDKKVIFQEIIQLENLFMRGSPMNPTFNIAKADALTALGMYREALAIYSKFPGRAASRIKAVKEKMSNRFGQPAGSRFR